MSEKRERERDRDRETERRSKRGVSWMRSRLKVGRVTCGSSVVKTPIALLPKVYRHFEEEDAEQRRRLRVRKQYLR
jgi:hypothetical protein